MPGVNVASWAEVSEVQPRLSTVGFLFSRGRKGLWLTKKPRTSGLFTGYRHISHGALPRLFSQLFLKPAQDSALRAARCQAAAAPRPSRSRSRSRSALSRRGRGSRAARCALRPRTPFPALRVYFPVQPLPRQERREREVRERGPGRAPRGRVRAEPPPLLFQVYPEPRTEGECLSNIREFLRGCGASLRLEVSGAPREGAVGPAGPAGSVPGGAALPPSCLCADKMVAAAPPSPCRGSGAAGSGAALRFGSAPSRAGLRVGLVEEPGCGAPGCSPCP